jgi:putative peptidoglycan lipid II flippase
MAWCRTDLEHSLMEGPAEETGRIAKAAGTVSIAVMSSRILGLVREQVFAALFGAGYAYDSFVVAFRIPNLLRDLFGEGALSAAFVSVFSDYDTNQGQEATWRLANNVLVCIALLLSVLTLAGMIFAEPLVRFLVDADFEAIPGKVELTHWMTVIMFPFLTLVSLSSVVMGILNTKGRFFLPAMASSFFNMGSIVGGVSLAFLLPRFGYPAIVGMAIGTLIGGLCQLVGQFPALAGIGFSFRPHLDLKSPGLRRIGRLMIPAVVGLAPLQLTIFVNTYFASSLPEGSLSWLNYAFRFFWFPVGIFGVALSVAALPVMARQAAQGDMVKLKETLASSLTMVFCLTIPATIGLVLLGEPIIRVIFEHGRFDAFSTARTAEALTCYAVGLFAYSAVKVMVPVFYALDETRYPVVGSFMVTVVNVGIIFLTIGRLQHQALALSISLAMTGNFIFLAAMLYRLLSGFSVGYILNGLVKVAAASLVMGLWVWFTKFLLIEWTAQSLVREIAGLVMLIGSGALIYGCVLYGMRMKELTLLLEKVRQRRLSDTP